MENLTKHKYFLYSHHVSGSRKILSPQEIIEQDVKHDVYTSLFHFDESIVEYNTRTGGIAGYNGKTYGDYFVLDFDAEPGDLKELTTKIRPILDDLEGFEYYIFFSGK